MRTVKRLGYRASIVIAGLSMAEVASAFDHLEIEVVNPNIIQGYPAVTVEVPFSVRVRAVDAFGNIDPTADFVNAELYSPDVSASLPPRQYLSGGEVQFDNVIFHQAGNAVRLRVRDFDDPSVPHATVLINSYNFVESFVISIPPGDKTVGVPINIDLTAVDGGGNPVANFADDVTLSAAIGHFPSGATVNVSGGLFNLGDASISLTFLGTDPVTRENVLTVTNSRTYQGQTGPAEASATVSPLWPGPLSTVVLLLPGETLTPGVSPGKTGTPFPLISGVTQNNVDVYATDQYWNPVRTGPYPGLSWSSSDGGAGVQLPAAGPMSSNSDLDNAVRLITAGVQRVAVDASGPVTATSESFVNVNPEGLDHFVFDYAIWDTTDVQVTTNAFPVRVMARDAANNPFPFNGEVSVRVRIGASDESENYIIIPDRTFVNGVLNTTVQVTKRAFTARLIVDSNGGIIAESGTFQVNSGPLQTFLITYPGETWVAGLSLPGFPGKIGIPDPTTAGLTVSATIRPVDRFFNIATGTWTITVDCPTGYIELPGYPGGVLTLSNPVNVDVIFRTYQNQRLTAASNPNNEGISSPISVSPAPFDRVVVAAPGEILAPGIFDSIENDGKTGNPATQDAGIPFDVIVYTTDGYWNPVQDSDPVLPIDIDFGSSDPAATLPAGTQNIASNTETFEVTLETLDVLSQQTITIDDAGSSANAFTTIPLQAGTIHHFDIGINNRTTPSPNDPLELIPDHQAGSALPNVTIVARDQFGNHIANYTDSVSVLVTHGSGVVSPMRVSLGAGFGAGSYQGVWRGPVTITKSGVDVRLIVREDVFAVTDSSNTFDVFPGPFSKLLVMLPGEVHAPGVAPGKVGTPLPAVVGQTLTATVLATDAWWNQVPAQRTVNLSTSAYSIFLSQNNVALEPDGHRDYDLYFRTAGVQDLIARDLVMSQVTNTSTIALTPGGFTRLQIIAPGETPNPGGPETDGKVGAPLVQTASLEFDVEVRSVDQFWNLVDNNDEHIRVTADDGSLTDTNPQNQGQSLLNGSITFPLFLTSTGTVRVDAAPLDNLELEGQHVDINVQPGASYVIDVPPTAYVGPPQNFTMTVSLVDSLGNPETGANNEVTLTVFKSNMSPASGVLGQTSVTLSQGVATLTNQTYNVVEDIVIQVTDLAGRVMNSTPIQMLPNELEYHVTVDETQPIIAGPPRRFGVTVELRDAETGTLVDTDRALDVSIWSVANDSLGVGVVGTRVASLSGGRSVFQESYTKAEDVYVSVADSTGLVGNSSIFTIAADGYKRLQAFVPGEVLEPGNPLYEGTGKRGTPDAQRSGELFPIVVRAVDQFWNLADTTNVGEVHLVASDGSFTAGNPAQQDVPFVSGRRTFDVFVVDEGIVDITAFDFADLDRPEQRVSVPVLPSYEYEITVPATAFTGPVPGFQVTVRLYDPATGNTVPASNNRFYMTPLLANQAIANGSLGYDEGQLIGGVDVINDQSYDTVEDIIIRVTDDFGREAFSSVIEMESGGLYYDVVLPDTATVGGPSTFPVDIVLLDSNTGNVVTTQDGLVDVEIYSANSGQLGVGTWSVNVELLNQGFVTFNQSYTKAEDVFIQVSDANGVTGISNTTTLLPDGYKRIQLVAPGETATPGVPGPTGKSGMALTQQAEVPFNVTARAVDQYWNLVTPQSGGSINLTSSEGSLGAGNPSNQGSAFINGIVSFDIVLSQQGQATIYANDTVTQGIAAGTAVVGVNDATYEIIVPAQATVGPPSSFSITVRLINPTTGETIDSSNQFFLEARRPNHGTALDTLGVQQGVLNRGELQIPNQTYATTQDIVIRVYDALGREAYSDVINMRPVGIRYDVIVPATAQVGPPASFQMTVRLVDVLTGQIVTGDDRSFSIEVFNATTGAPGSGVLGVTTATLVEGAVMLPQTYSRSENIYFVVSDPTGDQVFSSTIQMQAGAPSGMTFVSSATTLESGESATLTATLIDLFDNPVSNQPVTFTVLDGDGWVSADSSTTNSNGIAAVSVTVSESGREDLFIEARAPGVGSRTLQITVIGPPITVFEVLGNVARVSGGFLVTPDSQIRLSASSQIGVGATFFGVNIGPLDTPSNIYTGPMSLAQLGHAEPGVYTIRFYSQDTNLNSEEVQEERLYLTEALKTDKKITNRPNPFRAGSEETVIIFRSTQSGPTEVTIYDPYGNRVWSTVVTSQGGAENQVMWDGRNGNGKVAGNGGYICRIKTPAETLTRKIAIVK